MNGVIVDDFAHLDGVLASRHGRRRRCCTRSLVEASRGRRRRRCTRSRPEGSTYTYDAATNTRERDRPDRGEYDAASGD